MALLQPSGIQVPSWSAQNIFQNLNEFGARRGLLTKKIRPFPFDLEWIAT
jgi:hypothetical protein